MMRLYRFGDPSLHRFWLITHVTEERTDGQNCNAYDARNKTRQNIQIHASSARASSAIKSLASDTVAAIFV